MKDVFVSGTHIISPLGRNTQENYKNISQNRSGIELHNKSEIHPVPFYSSIIKENTLQEINEKIQNFFQYTRLEKLIIYSIQSLIEETNTIINDKTLIVLSTTKGNISLLNQNSKFPENRIHLSLLANEIQKYFNLNNKIITISNACISGSLAISVARDLLQSPKYEKAIVIGADEVSKFIFSGFSSFQAIAAEPCKPFDKNRQGVTLGEAAASVLLTKEAGKGLVKIGGIGSYNDANHISGPSRTGEGLYRSIQKSLQQAEINKVDFISAHGTATLYNDEMESIALQRSNLQDIEVNSLKGYYGHTLGASGIIESILSIESLKNNYLIKSLGFEEQGTTHQLNIIKRNTEKNISSFLKTASGFGGCNIATVFLKNY